MAGLKWPISPADVREPVHASTPATTAKTRAVTRHVRWIPEALRIVALCITGPPASGNHPVVRVLSRVLALVVGRDRTPRPVDSADNYSGARALSRIATDRTDGSAERGSAQAAIMFLSVIVGSRSRHQPEDSDVVSEVGPCLPYPWLARAHTTPKPGSSTRKVASNIVLAVAVEDSAHKMGICPDLVLSASTTPPIAP